MNENLSLKSLYLLCFHSKQRQGWTLYSLNIQPFCEVKNLKKTSLCAMLIFCLWFTQNSLDDVSHIITELTPLNIHSSIGPSLNGIR